MIAMPVESAGGGRLLSLGASVILVKKFVEFLWSINTAIFIRDCDSFYALADQVAGRLYGVLSRGFAIAEFALSGLAGIGLHNERHFRLLLSAYHSLDPVHHRGIDAPLAAAM